MHLPTDQLEPRCMRLLRWQVLGSYFVFYSRKFVQAKCNARVGNQIETTSFRLCVPEFDTVGFARVRLMKEEQVDIIYSKPLQALFDRSQGTLIAIVLVAFLEVPLIR